MDEIKAKGTLYGVSVGPGDPELITLRALHCIEKCEVIAAPQTKNGGMLALDIARGAADLSGKTIVPLRFAMSRDAAEAAAAHRQAAAALRVYLDKGQDVAVLNIGDISIYATFDYLQRILQPQGYTVRRIAGVPSFCAAAARLGRSLTGGMDEPLTIAPAACVGQALDERGSKVLMKLGHRLPQAIDELEKRGLLESSAMVCACGLDNEKLYSSLAGYNAAEEAGYFSTILVSGG